MLTTRRHAFTMLELIFVIVIVGLLSAVAIPRLAVSRDDAEASLCEHEIGTLIDEISSSYIRNGYNNFKNLAISDISTINSNIGLNESGIIESGTTKIDGGGITYSCKGEPIIKLVGKSFQSDYSLTLIDQNPVGSIGLKTVIHVRKTYQLQVGGTRIFRL